MASNEDLSILPGCAALHRQRLRSPGWQDATSTLLARVGNVIAQDTARIRGD